MPLGPCPWLVALSSVLWPCPMSVALSYFLWRCPVSHGLPYVPWASPMSHGPVMHPMGMCRHRLILHAGPTRQLNWQTAQKWLHGCPAHIHQVATLRESCAMSRQCETYHKNCGVAVQGTTRSCGDGPIVLANHVFSKYLPLNFIGYVTGFTGSCVGYTRSCIGFIGS